MMATITEASAKIAPMMVRMMVIEAVLLSGEAELVETDATGFTLEGADVPEPRVAERDMIFCSRSVSRSLEKILLGVSRERDDLDVYSTKQIRSNLSQTSLRIYSHSLSMMVYPMHAVKLRASGHIPCIWNDARSFTVHM
jgi:hypothetical protein